MGVVSNTKKPIYKGGVTHQPIVKRNDVLDNGTNGESNRETNMGGNMGESPMSKIQKNRYEE